MEERGTLWNQVISRKYEIEEGGWCNREVREGYEVGFWKEIRKEWPFMKDKFAFSVGNGRRVRFWEDRWCGDKALSISFPSLYALATSKEVWVVEVWDTIGEVGGWNPRFLRPFNNWEFEMVERFLFSLQGKRVVFNLEDKLRWKEAKGGNFSIKSFYSALEGGGTVPFPTSIIWSPYAPINFGFFSLGSHMG